MFVENYRLDTMIGGQPQSIIPYPKISDEDWVKWKAFLPVKSEVICKRELLSRPRAFLHTAYGIPPDVSPEITQGARHFDEIEVWGKRKIRKDPIAVGLTGNGERYLICRWGMDKLIPFEKIKSRSWLYHIENFIVTLLTSAIFWLGGAAATLLAMSYIAGQKQLINNAQSIAHCTTHVPNALSVLLISFNSGRRISMVPRLNVNRRLLP